MNGIILVNKKADMTSFDLVKIAKRKLNVEKVGHTGTLDPLATGLMMLTIGNSTKLLPYISHFYKEYVCTMKLGYKTDTLDVSGTVIDRKDIKPFSKEDIDSVLLSFMGQSQQVPPMYSAKKVNGKHLYDLARKNVEIERKPCSIEIKEIKLLNYSLDMISFSVVCSVGTYIRVLVNDIANKLDNFGCMEKLIRTRIDDYKLQDAYEIDDLNEDIKTISNYDILKNNYQMVEYKNIDDIKNGKSIVLEGYQDRVIIVTNKEVIAAYQKAEDGRYYSSRGLW